MKTIFLLVLFLFVSTSCHENNPSVDDGKLLLKVKVVGQRKTNNCGTKSRVGDILSIHYTGSFLNGTRFDSSLNRSEPFQFQIGTGQVIRGLDQGLIGMCLNEKRKLIMPSHLAYGKKGAGKIIPPDATLVFQVQLVQIIDSPPPKYNVFKQIDLNGDNRLSQGEVVESFIRRLVRMKQDGFNITDALVEETKETGRNYFKVQDVDRNGFVSHEEFIGPKVDQEFELDRNNYVVLFRYDLDSAAGDRGPILSDSVFLIIILIATLLVVLNILLILGTSEKSIQQFSMAKQKFFKV